MNQETKKKQHLMCGIFVVVALAVGFGGGMFYAQSTTPARGSGSGFSGTGGPGGSTAGRGRNMMAGGFTAGTISSMDANSITVTLQSGPNSANGSSSGSRIVLYSGSTQIAKSVAGTPADLSVGQSVTVSGTPNTDGSITAQMIQLRPAGSPGMGGGRGGGAPAGGQGAPAPTTN
jgi:hypothetical protein